LDGLITEAGRRERTAGWLARVWQSSGLTLGYATAVLAGLAGVTGLATTTGRVPAAIVALAAAGLTTGNQFLHTDDHYEKNLRRRNAWEALRLDAQLDRARAAEQTDDELREVIDALLRRRLAIRNLNHQPLPDATLGIVTTQSKP
jgi:hypothetical protein